MKIIIALTVCLLSLPLTLDAAMTFDANRPTQKMRDKAAKAQAEKFMVYYYGECSPGSLMRGINGDYFILLGLPQNLRAKNKKQMNVMVKFVGTGQLNGWKEEFKNDKDVAEQLAKWGKEMRCYRFMGMATPKS